MENTTNRRIGDKVQIDGSYQYNAYYNGRAPQRFWHYAKIDGALKALNVKSGEEVLDVGCGSGLVSYFISTVEGVNVTALDANIEALTFAKNKFNTSNIKYINGLLDDVKLPSNSFNKVVFLEVIEHISLEQGKEVLRTFNRILKDNGTVVISTPNRRSLWPFIEWALDFFKIVPNLADEQHEFLYTGNLLVKIAKDAGLKCIDRRSINTFAPWISPISWGLAEFIHKLEFRYNRKFGSILLYTFEKT